MKAIYSSFSLISMLAMLVSAGCAVISTMHGDLIAGGLFLFCQLAFSGLMLGFTNALKE